VTHPRIYVPPTPLAKALDQVDAWLESPKLALLAESATHWSVLRALLIDGRVIGAQVHDARIAALAGSTVFASYGRRTATSAVSQG
jgi:uncharacterized protein